LAASKKSTKDSVKATTATDTLRKDDASTSAANSKTVKSQHETETTGGNSKQQQV
jgi:hypothetical protein